jgi:acyl carrier protein
MKMTFEKVKNIIAEQLGVDDVNSITEQTSLIEDLEADSLDAVEIIMSLEDEFDISIPDEEAENFKNIGDIVNYIDENIA